MAQGKDRIETWICVIAAVFTAYFYLWTALEPARPWILGYRDPSGYYPLLTAGFRSGHLYTANAPSTELLALADPYDPVANAPYRVHDMSLYRGHYYLYFGAAPVLLFFWPCVALTGMYPTEALATALFCAGAVGAGIALLLRVRRRFYPEAPTLALVLAVVCLGFASPLNQLVEAPQFYQVAISCAVFLQALMLWAALRSLDSGRRLAWLSVAGLLCGLSVAARPNYVAGIVPLLVVVAAEARQVAAVSQDDRRRKFIRLAAFTFAPAAACGAALLLYNALRFGSVFELGARYQLTGESVAGMQHFSIGNLAPHLADYLFKPALWQTYFPFFAGDSVTGYGLVRYLPWTWLAAAAFIFLGGSSPLDAGRRVVARCVGVACLASLALLCCFVATNVRYTCDFANVGMLLAGIGALALGQKASESRRGPLACATLLAAAGVSLFNSLDAYADRFADKGKFSGVARAANWPVFLWQRSHGAQFGALHLQLLLPEQHPDNSEPIFETGRQADQRDWVQIDYLGEDRARLDFFHAGSGELDGAEFAIPEDRRIDVELHCGSLLPPFDHPAFAGWTLDEYLEVRSELRLSVNGVDVMRTALECYGATPASFSFGRLKWPMGGMEEAFSGTITGVARLPIVRPPAVATPSAGDSGLEMDLILPAKRARGAEPILLSGSGSRSDLLYCAYDGMNQVRFGMDHFGTGGPTSEYVPFDALVPHTVVASMGPRADSAARLLVVFDGRTLIDSVQKFYPPVPGSIVVGSNRFGSTAAGARFTGIVMTTRAVPLVGLPVPARNDGYGAVDMVVNFPQAAIGAAEPLVVTGTTRSGDFVYVKYIDSGHVALGYDHWSVGGVLSEPIAVDYREAHRVSVAMDSLEDPAAPAPRSHSVRVLLDGTPVLNFSSPCYPSTLSQIRIGRNDIGGSTCSPAFSGEMVLVERFPGRHG
jgi:hypothetical protein